MCSQSHPFIHQPCLIGSRRTCNELLVHSPTYLHNIEIILKLEPPSRPHRPIDQKPNVTFHTSSIDRSSRISILKHQSRRQSCSITPGPLRYPRVRRKTQSYSHTHNHFVFRSRRTVTSSDTVILRCDAASERRALPRHQVST